MTVPDVSSEEVKTFKLTALKLDLAEARMGIAAAATGCDVRLVSVEESRSRLRTHIDLTVTVAGHPHQIRDFHAQVGGGSGSGNSWWLWGGDGGLDDFVFGIVGEAVVDPLFQAAKRKWQARHDPPIPGKQPIAGPGDSRTTVNWTWKQLLPDGDAAGPVRVDTYAAGQEEPTQSEDWPRWVKRSEALAFAQEHGFVFLPQDLPDS